MFAVSAPLAAAPTSAPTRNVPRARQQRHRAHVAMASATKHGEAEAGSVWCEPVRRAGVVFALSAALAVGPMAVVPSAALAGLNKAGGNDAYAEMMKQLEARRPTSDGTQRLSGTQPTFLF